MYLSHLVQTGLSNFGSQKIKAISASRQSLGITALFLTWYTFRRCNYYSHQAQTIQWEYGELTKQGRYWCTLGSLNSRRLTISPPSTQATSRPMPHPRQMCGWLASTPKWARTSKSTQVTQKAPSTSLRQSRLGAKPRNAYSNWPWLRRKSTGSA